jgi:N-acetylmuramoyl-L-alanine amidase
VFGPKTETAVKRWQQRYNETHTKKIAVDGVVGPITWAKMFPVLSLVKKPGRIIVLDIGHGMDNTRPGVFDSGATAHGKREYDVNVHTVSKLKARLEAKGRVVRVIRDVYVGRRDEIAAGFNPAIIVSNHKNSGGSGVLVLVASNAGTWIRKVAGSVAKAISHDTGLRLEALNGVLVDYRGLAIFKALPQRTILIEWGHISSAADEAKTADKPGVTDPIDKAIEATANILAGIK